MFKGTAASHTPRCGSAEYAATLRVPRRLYMSAAGERQKAKEEIKFTIGCIKEKKEDKWELRAQRGQGGQAGRDRPPTPRFSSTPSVSLAIVHCFICYCTLHAFDLSLSLRLTVRASTFSHLSCSERPLLLSSCFCLFFCSCVWSYLLLSLSFLSFFSPRPYVI